MRPRSHVAALAGLAILMAQCWRLDPAPSPGGQEPVRLCLSGELEGRIEPCGCAMGQLGGLARRAFYLGKHPFDLRIEGGNIADGSSELDLLKYSKTVEVLASMTGYDALAVGPRDLELNYPDWSRVLHRLAAPVIASDLECRDAAWPARPFVEKPVRSQRVRIAALTMAVPDTWPQGAPEVALLTPAQGWQRALADCAPDTLRVLLVHAEVATVTRLANSLQPPPDLVIGVNEEFHEPPTEATLVGQVPVVFPGVQGRMLLDVTLTRRPPGPRIGYQVIRLEGSETKPDTTQDERVRASITQHRFEVRDQGILQKLAGRRPTRNGAEFVGSVACGQCHAAAFEVWTNSKHAAAWATLVAAEADPKRYGWPVTAYPDCVGCHSVGYGRESGFAGTQDTAQLVNVGCENCHGAGSRHVAEPEQVKLGRVGDGMPSKPCFGCHNTEQSPGFDFAVQWRKIVHGK